MTIETVQDGRIPVTILSGFLGSGKTTLLKSILESQSHQMRIAVIVNDMAEINVDAEEIAQRGIVHAKREIITLQNGCICCTLRGDLIREINAIRELHEFDYILIESTGIAEPQQVAESFCADPATAELADDPEKMLWNIARLDTCVTVIDAYNFISYVSSLRRFKEEFSDGLDKEDSEEGEKSIADLIVEQVEFSNVIILNKIDLVSESTKETLMKLLKSLNAKARIVATTFGEIDVSLILNTNLFSMEEAEESAGWLESLKLKDAKSEAEEFGLTSFVYRARKPFHPNRLFHWIEQIFLFSEKWNKGQSEVRENRTEFMKLNYGLIMRSKGFCWIAGRDDLTGSWNNFGQLINIEKLCPWFHVLEESEWGVEEDEEISNIKSKFEGTFGDRRQEIVFIGVDLIRDAIVASLNDCLLNDNEMKGLPNIKKRYYDPLPAWSVEYDSIGFTSAVLRCGQDHKFEVKSGYCLIVSNIALNYPENFPRLAVKLWLQHKKLDTLLVTLKSGVCEQYPVMLTLSDHDTEPFTMWLETNGEKHFEDQIEVYIMMTVKEDTSSTVMHHDDCEHEHDSH